MNITQTAKALDVSVATVSRICAGERRPSVDLIFKIRTVLGWSVDGQAQALAESTTKYANEFEARMSRRREPRVDART